MNAKPKEAGQADSNEPAEPAFRYTLELVATIAAHFVDGSTNETAASERAIKLLDAVSETIRRKTILLRARARAERISEESPKHLPFADGIRWITGRGTETEAITPFREYLRLNIRLSDLHRPSQLTEEQVKALLAPLPEGEAKDVEDARVQKIEARYREAGFNQVQLVTIKEAWERLQAGFVRPFRNSKKGKMPPAPGKQRGRPRGTKKTSKKSLVRKPTPKN